MKATIHITLKNGVLEPQGKAIENVLSQLGFQGVDEVRQGKLVEVNLSESDPAKAEAALTDMCEKLLANTVIENYHIHLDSE